MTTPMDLTDTLRQRRLEAGLSQDAVAERAGVDAGAIGRYERRVQSPRLHILLAWMGALGLAFEIVPAPPRQRRSALLGSTALTPPGRAVAARPVYLAA